MLFELPVFYGQTVKLVDMKVGVKIRFTLPRFAKYKRQKLAYERKKKFIYRYNTFALDGSFRHS